MPALGSLADGLDEALEPELARLCVACDRALEAVDLGAAELSLLLCSDTFIADLNRTWRGVDGPTDVLSFPQEAPPEPLAFDGVPQALGDVVISVDTARSQAAALGHDLHTELAVLAVHGLCHVVGCDHEAPDEARVMAELEARMLRAVGCSAASGLVVRGGTAG